MNVMKPLPKIVNVASVPKRSPFRYPGGKTWLVPYIRAWLKSLSQRPSCFVEPFAGGGIVSLTVGFERLADAVVMNELDEEVSAVWRTIFGNNAKWLCERIRTFDMSVDAVRAELAISARSLRQKAFQTILKNRTYHGGILAHGSGLIKHGENGKGVKSRWYADTLCERILSIWELRSSFTFFQEDGIAFMAERTKNADTIFFIDPPYTAGGNGKRAGRRLYNHNELNHEHLFDVAANVAGDFLMTYDNDEEVVALAKSRGFDMELVPMKNTHHAEMVELLIGPDLDWVRRMLHPKTERLLF